MSNSKPPVTDEKLSQLMDGEWYGLSPTDCVVDICQAEERLAKWSRYHLIRDVIKNEPVEYDKAIASRICAAISEEPSYTNITPFSTLSTNVSESQTSHQTVKLNAEAADAQVAVQKTESGNSHLRTGAAGFALAASVGMATFVGMSLWQNEAPESAAATFVASNTASEVNQSSAFSTQIEGAPLPEVEFVANTGSYWSSPQTAERVTYEHRLNMFLSQHLENSPSANREGLLSYSSLVGYVESRQEP